MYDMKDMDKKSDYLYIKKTCMHWCENGSINILPDIYNYRIKVTEQEYVYNGYNAYPLVSFICNT